MKHRTNKEIKAKLEEIWPDCDDLTFTKLDDRSIIIEASQMYEYVPLSFAILMELSNFFETKNIDDADKESWPGCESCDYGSRYIIRLKIAPEK